jgi:hypothetical protein
MKQERGHRNVSAAKTTKCHRPIQGTKACVAMKRAIYTKVIEYVA